LVLGQDKTRGRVAANRPCMKDLGFRKFLPDSESGVGRPHMEGTRSHDIPGKNAAVVCFQIKQKTLPGPTAGGKLRGGKKRVCTSWGKFEERKRSEGDFFGGVKDAASHGTGSFKRKEKKRASKKM